MSAILSRLDPAWYADRRSELEHGWNDLLSLADHAWNGAFERNRELNARLRHGWQIEANRTFDRLIDSGLEALGRQIPTRDSRSDGLQHPGLGAKWTGAIDWGATCSRTRPRSAGMSCHSSKPAKAVRLQDTSWRKVCLPWDIECTLWKRNPWLASGQRTVIAQDNCLDGPFYRIEINPATGAIASLYDKTRQRELVDPTSAYGLNEAVYPSTTELSIKPAPYQLFHGIDLSGMSEQSARLVSMAAGNCSPIWGAGRT